MDVQTLLGIRWNYVLIFYMKNATRKQYTKTEKEINNLKNMTAIINRSRPNKIVCLDVCIE